MTTVKCELRDCTNNKNGKCKENEIEIEWGKVKNAYGFGVCQSARSRSTPVVANGNGIDEEKPVGT